MMSVKETEASAVPAAESEPAALANSRQVPRADAARGRRERWVPAGVAALVALASLILPLGWSGLWAPYELETAELARRIAVGLHGAAQLGLDGAHSQVPTLTELGRGQLPFSSVALGFQLFGLFDWAGRLPLAVWGLAALAATFMLVSRLAGRVAAAYACVALATMPIFFLQARTLLGDIVTLSAVALASTGLALGVFHPSGPDAAPPSHLARAGWAALALVGLASGFASRGVLFGVACPALGVGLAWLTWRSAGRRCASRYAEAVGALSLVIGAAALGLGLWALFLGGPDAYLEILGAHLSEPSKLPTHDAVLHQLGFGLFPWSAVAPFAFSVVLSPENDDAESALGLCLVSVFAVSFAAHGLSAPYIGPLPFVGTFAVAGLVGVAFRRAETRASGTRLIALGAAALLIVFVYDLRSSPGQSLLPYVLSGTTLPESFATDAKSWMKFGALPCLALLAVALGELPPHAPGHGFGPGSDYARWLKALSERWHGRLSWLLMGGTLLLGVLPVLRFLQSRGVQVPLLGALGGWARPLGYAFLIIPGCVAIPLVTWLLRDLAGHFLSLLERIGLPRARLGVAALAAFGLALSVGYYPALAAQLSPRDVFESFRQRAKPGEALAVLGEASRVAPYYAGAAVHEPKSPKEGLDWLLAAPAERRWLVLSARDLGQLNSSYRQRITPPANLPILDAVSSEVLLASNQLAAGEPNANPLSIWVTRERPQPERPLDVDLNGQLRCIGWAITDPKGHSVPHVTTGQPYDFRIYWEVLEPQTSNWKTFIHIDGNRRRYNGDHDTLQGKYPFKYWQKGDFVMDVHRMQLEPHFSGSTYQVFFGLFMGDRRLAVKRGNHQDDRIMGGNLVVD